MLSIHRYELDLVKTTSVSACPKPPTLGFNVTGWSCCTTWLSLTIKSSSFGTVCTFVSPLVVAIVIS
jgi:hypothetical protein